MPTGDGQQPRQRQPLTWPTAVFGLGVLVLLGVVAWICGGVASDWVGR
jgi:hypothetical protein